MPVFLFIRCVSAVCPNVWLWGGLYPDPTHDFNPLLCICYVGIWLTFIFAVPTLETQHSPVEDFRLCSTSENLEPNF